MRNYNNMFNPIRFNISDHTYLLRSIELTKSYNEPVTANIVAEEVDPSEPYFGSLFDIKKVIFNDPATIVLWKDGTKTVVKCQDGDVYDEQTGLLMCMVKKMYGNDGKFNDVLRKWMPKEETLEDMLQMFSDMVLDSIKKVFDSHKIKDGEETENSECGPGMTEEECKLYDDYCKATYENNGWIPCSERLPEKDGRYITTVNWSDDRPILVNFKNGRWLIAPEDEVIAWMPLPEIYKGE